MLTKIYSSLWYTAKNRIVILHNPVHIDEEKIMSNVTSEPVHFPSKKCVKLYRMSVSFGLAIFRCKLHRILCKITQFLM